MKANLITAPASEPITLEELKIHIKMESDIQDEDEYLETLIKTARGYVEQVTRRALFTQTWDYFLDCWPDGDFITLPFGNLQSVTSAKYKDTAGTETTMTVATDYLVETNDDQHGQIVLPYGTAWPSTTLYPSNPIIIRFVCGWTTQALIPYGIKAAVKLLCSDMYEDRGEKVIGQSLSESPIANRLLQSYRLWGNF